MCNGTFAGCSDVRRAGATLAVGTQAVTRPRIDHASSHPMRAARSPSWELACAICCPRTAPLPAGSRSSSTRCPPSIRRHRALHHHLEDDWAGVVLEGSVTFEFKTGPQGGRRPGRWSGVRTGLRSRGGMTVISQRGCCTCTPTGGFEEFFSDLASSLRSGWRDDGDPDGRGRGDPAAVDEVRTVPSADWTQQPRARLLRSRHLTSGRSSGSTHGAIHGTARTRRVSPHGSIAVLQPDSHTMITLPRPRMCRSLAAGE